MGVREADPLRGKEQINTWLLRARCEDRLGPQEPEVCVWGGGSGILRTPTLAGCFCTAGEIRSRAGAVGWAQPVRMKPKRIRGSPSDELRVVADSDP